MDKVPRQGRRQDRPPSGRRPLPLVVGMAALVLVVPVQLALNDARDAHALLPTSAAEAPGLQEVTLTTGLGAARAFVNISTWNAIHQAQNEREYYRLIALCRAVLRLQPNNTVVQAFLARQMINTVSRTEADRDAAWEWVRQGKEMLMTAQARNPRSAEVRRGLSHLYYEMLAEHPFRVLRADLARGDDAVLAPDPAWHAAAREALAAYDEMDDAQRARLDHAISRIGYELVHADDLTQFMEFQLLPRHAQRVYEEVNRLRHRMSFFVLLAALDPAHRVEGPVRIVMAQWATNRIEALFVHTVRQTPQARLDEQSRLWRWAVNLYEWLPSDDERRYAVARRIVWSRLAGIYDDFPPRPGAVMRDGVDLTEHYFGAGVTGPPDPPP